MADQEEQKRKQMERRSKMWLVLGCGMLGALSGLLIGLSVSPVANTALGVLLGFAGAIFSLSQKTEPEMVRTGQTTFFFALFTLGGLVIGLVSRVNDVLKAESHPTVARYVINEPLSIKEIVELAKLSPDPEIVRRLVLSSPRKAVSVSLEDRKLLVQEHIHPAILLAILEPEHPMNRLPLVVEKEDMADANKTSLMREVLKQISAGNGSSGAGESSGLTKLYEDRNQKNLESRDDAAIQYRE